MGNLGATAMSCFRRALSCCFRNVAELDPQEVEPLVSGPQELLAKVTEKYGQETRNLLLKHWREALALAKKENPRRLEHFLGRAETSPQAGDCPLIAEKLPEHLVGFVCKLILYAPTEWYEVVTGKPLPEGKTDDFSGMGVAFDASSRLRRAGVEYYHNRLSLRMSPAYPRDDRVFYAAPGADKCTLMAADKLPEPDADAIRVVAVSDTHLCHNTLHLPRGDVLVHAGDLSFEESRSIDGEHFMDLIRKPGTLTKEKIKEWLPFNNAALSEALQWLSKLSQFEYRVLVGGNHDFILEQMGVDLATEICKDYNVHYLHTKRQPDKLPLKNGRIVSVWGSAVSTQKGLDNTQAALSGNGSFQYELGSEEDFRQDTKHVARGDVDILVTHAPPVGSLMGKEGKTFQAIGDLVSRVNPKLYICGHAHNGRDLTSERWKKLEGGGLGVNAACLGVWNQRHGFPIVMDIKQ